MRRVFVVRAASCVLVAGMALAACMGPDKPAHVITSIAGNGEAGFGGDNGLAVKAQLRFPEGLAADPEGNVYIADTGNEKVRRVDHVTGVITTVAGTGVLGFSGDNGPALEAQLAAPSAVAVDAVGNLFITDRGNHRVRRVDLSSGVITTVVGTGEAGFAGDNGHSLNAQLRFPNAVAVDPVGNLFISDRANHRVRRVDHATGEITTVAGTGEAGFGGDNGPAGKARLSSPGASAVDEAGNNLFIADVGNARVRRVDLSSGVITTVAGTGEAGFGGDNGPAVNAQLSVPSAVAVGVGGSLYIADRGNGRVRRVDHATGVITSVAGTGKAGFGGDNGPAAYAQLGAPNAVAVARLGSLFISDSENQRVREVQL